MRKITVLRIFSVLGIILMMLSNSKDCRAQSENLDYVEFTAQEESNYGMSLSKTISKITLFDVDNNEKIGEITDFRTNQIVIQNVPKEHRLKAEIDVLDGYKFVEFKIERNYRTADIKGSDNPFYFQISKDDHKVLVCIKVMPTLTYRTLNEGGVIEAEISETVSWGRRTDSFESGKYFDIYNNPIFTFKSKSGTGYKVKQWFKNGDEVSTDAEYKLENPKEPVEITATFEKEDIKPAQPHKLTIERSDYIESYNVVDAITDTLLDLNNILTGSKVKIKYIPMEGYYIKLFRLKDSRTGDNIKSEFLKDYKSNEFTFEMPDNDVSIQMLYPVAFVVLKVAGGKGGSIECEDMEVGGSEWSYPIRRLLASGDVQIHKSNFEIPFDYYNHSYTLVAKPDENMKLSKWKINGIETIANGNKNPLKLTSSSKAVIVEAFFDKDNKQTTVKVNFHPNDPQKGSVSATINGKSIESGSTIPVNSVIHLTAHPAEGYIVKEWKSDGSTISGSESKAEIDYTAIKDINYLEVVFIKQKYSKITYSIDKPDLGKITLSHSDSSGIIQNGAIIPENSRITAKFTPIKNAILKKWKINESEQINNEHPNWIDINVEKESVNGELNIVAIVEATEAANNAESFSPEISISNGCLMIKSRRKADIRIYSIDGKLILSNYIENISINLDNGLYILCIDKKSYKIHINKTK